MPNLTVDYSEPLAGTFDATALGRDLHIAVEKTVGSSPSACRTHFRRIEQSVIGEGGELGDSTDVAHIEVALFAGRTTEAKAELASAVLALAKERVTTLPGRRLRLSVHISELDQATYLTHQA
ncbi:isomerase [Streptomyces sp. OF3]|uniref:Isomerase n=1 Tax=Streptomyces alkaliterrae TaxID=2213162 RepID=A0A7W3ZPG9_9ACTN|nr:isomerase [Streptomyces alkaliterrae]MBB1255969.1 isomerase [Streptomyces alkaliterrae]